jgi:hypothetical protein
MHLFLELNLRNQTQLWFRWLKRETHEKFVSSQPTLFRGSPLTNNAIIECRELGGRFGDGREGGSGRHGSGTKSSAQFI